MLRAGGLGLPSPKRGFVVERSLLLHLYIITITDSRNSMEKEAALLPHVCSQGDALCMSR